MFLYFSHLKKNSVNNLTLPSPHPISFPLQQKLKQTNKKTALVISRLSPHFLHFILNPLPLGIYPINFICSALWTLSIVSVLLNALVNYQFILVNQQYYPLWVSPFL